jgi:DNA polymerase I-like protein with 3'-5' exonuclease and polymerase domains
VPPEVSQKPEPVRIKRINPCGSHKVYDFEVKEDHSYETAGCFSHNSRNPNMQNTPKRGDMAKSFRKIFTPPIEGWKFLELDYSQIELRVAAWMAREQNMIKIYKEGGDIHSSTAAAVTNIPIKEFLKGRKDQGLLIEWKDRYKAIDDYLYKLDKVKRQTMVAKEYFDLLRYQAKAVNFGYLYGMWWKGFKVYAKTDYGIDYTDEEAEATRVRFFKNYPALEKWHRSMKNMANEKGYVRALHGSLRRLPNVDSFDDSIIGGAERQAINAPVQRFASDLGLIAVSRIFRDAPRDMIRPVLFIHDAIVPCVHPDYVDEAASAIKYYMENPPLKEWFGITPPFPLSADVSIGDNLGEMKELEGVVAKKPDWYRSGEECPSDDQALVEAWEKKKKRGIIVVDSIYE